MAVKRQKIRLGTRGSPLALTQAAMVTAALARVAPDTETEIVVIKTSGDWRPEEGETRLSEEKGGKGQFAKEIEEALLGGRIDAGVHSMKDMESHLPKGLVIDCMLPREDARDCVVLQKPGTIHKIDDLPYGFIIGTSSVRRAAFLKTRRPDFTIVPLRGNVETRLEKLRRREQGMGGIVLAYAGLKRLGLEHEASFLVPVEHMLPSAGQGAVGIEVPAAGSNILSIFGRISHLQTLICVKAERAALAVLDGSCHTPIGAHAVLKDIQIHLRLCVASPDSEQMFSEEVLAEVSGVHGAEEVGRKLAILLKQKLPAGFLI